MSQPIAEILEMLFDAAGVVVPVNPNAVAAAQVWGVVVGLDARRYCQGVAGAVRPAYLLWKAEPSADALERLCEAIRRHAADVASWEALATMASHDLADAKAHLALMMRGDVRWSKSAILYAETAVADAQAHLDMAMAQLL